MEYKQSMDLQSPSGYAMPFELAENEAPSISLGYGQQIHPQTDTEFFHHGVDFNVRQGTWLKALATGVVSGIASDMKKGYYITVTYPNYGDNSRSAYEVIYSHINESIVTFGQNLKAGDNVARCDSMFHMEVRFRGKEVDPLEFLTMVRDNLIMNDQTQMDGKNPEIATLDFNVHTPYDSKQAEIDQLMMRFFPSYIGDLFKGNYHVPNETERNLRSAIAEGARSGAYYEHMPSMLNPLGLGRRSFDLIGLIQTLLIQDFLNYLGVRHSLFLQGTSEDEKKKFLTGI